MTSDGGGERPKDGAGAGYTGAAERGRGFGAGSPGVGAGEVGTPRGTMVIVLIYAAATVGLWAYVYYHTLQFGGVVGGH